MTLTNAQVRNIVESTCDNIDAKNPGFAGLLGKGRINAFKALSATPLPPIGFVLLRKLPFPQPNNGSSTGLSYAKKLLVDLVWRRVVIFLTQQPFSEKIYYLNPINGAVFGSIDPVANDTIGSLEWDGGKYPRGERDYGLRLHQYDQSHYGCPDRHHPRACGSRRRPRL